MRFDHAIIAVYDLDTARADYKALGFTTFYGGQHTGGKTHNALIVFADGSYLELLAPTDPALLSSEDALSKKYFLRLLVRGEGLAGFAMHSADLDADVAAMRQRGLMVSDPTPNGRLRADGQRIAWKTAILENTMTPFFISDETPRVLRVPDDADKVTHAIGVSGVAGITVASLDMEENASRFEVILGRKPIEVNLREDFTRFTHENLSVMIAAPSTSNGELAQYLEKRGEVPYLLQLRAAEPWRSGMLDLKRAHGARIQIVP